MILRKNQQGLNPVQTLRNNNLVQFTMRLLDLPALAFQRSLVDLDSKLLSLGILRFQHHIGKSKFLYLQPDRAFFLLLLRTFGPRLLHAENGFDHEVIVTEASLFERDVFVGGQEHEVVS